MRARGGGLSEGTPQVPSVVSPPFKATVLSCYLPSRAQIHCSLSPPSNNWTTETRGSNLPTQRRLLGPWPSIFKTSETWHNQNVWYIKQFVFRVPKSIAEGGTVRISKSGWRAYWFKPHHVTFRAAAQITAIHHLTQITERSWLATRLQNNNNKWSSYAVEDAFHWCRARNEPVPSLYVQCSSYNSGREPRVLFKILCNYTSQYKYSQLHYVSLPCNLPTAIIICMTPLRANSS